jgi:hypothetical protein
MVIFHHHHDAEWAAYGQATREKRFDVLRFCAGGNVIILGFASQLQITHATAHPKGGVSGRLEAADDFARSASQRAGHGVRPAIMKSSAARHKSKSGGGGGFFSKTNP